MKKVIYLFLISIICLPLAAQINKDGTPLIKNYSTSDYNASEQNWTICEDNRGVIYVGNTNGVLEFDGNSWELIPLSNGSIIRSLATDKNGTVYVGGVAEFGYLAPDVNGKMKFNSLKNQLDSVDFKDVWKVYTIDNKVYFCSAQEIFVYKDKEFYKSYKNTNASFLSYLIDDHIYWGDYDGGLYKIQDDSVILTVGGEFYKEKDIFTMLPWSSNEVFIGTIGQGNYIYNTETGLTKSFKSLGVNYQKLANVLDQSQIYNGIKLTNGQYALATLNNGCLIFNQEGELVFKLNEENGLPNITVINLFEAKNGHLWLGMMNGISFIELNSPFLKFDSQQGIEGMAIDVERYNGTLYVATNLGLYYQYFDENELPHFKMVSGIDNMVWTLKKIKLKDGQTRLIAATMLNVYEIINYNQINKLDVEDEKDWQNCYSLLQSSTNQNVIYVGFKDGFGSFEYKNGQWNTGIHYKKITSNQIKNMAQDKDGNLWLATELNGIIKLNTKDSTTIRYGTEDGLPDVVENKVYYINDEIVCATIKGIYNFDKSGKFKKYEGFSEKYIIGDESIRAIYSNKENEYWIILVNPETNLEYIEKVNITQDRIVSINDIPFKRLLKKTFQDIAFDENNNVWIVTSDAVYNYQEKMNDDFAKFYNSLIRKVEIGIDSVVFWGTFYEDSSSLIVDLHQPNELKYIVDYKNNSFNFFFSTPFVPTDEIKYSSMLDGFDKSWSAWDEKTERGYTNLNDGRYTFKVKARNIYGIESEIISYEFTIKPPWYKTLVAYFIYLILAVLIIIVIVKIYTRRLELEKIRLEQIVKERTEEVVKQKDEIEKQRDEIADKNRSITDSIEYAKRIQTAVLPSSEYAQEILPEHFILFRPRDIVSGDFYWMTKKDNSLVVIAADCTGHGVPGAFMSMLGVSFLNEIVNRHDVDSAGEILTQLRADVKKTLGQEGKEGEAKDGMDIALCIVDLENMKMQYAGAYNPMYLYRNNELLETKADRMPIGIYVKEKESFTNNEIELQKGDVFYIFSDGFQDQFGGEDGQKFKTKNFKQLLLDIHQKPMAEQREILDTTIDKWRGEWEQVDDIIVMGIKV